MLFTRRSTTMNSNVTMLKPRDEARPRVALIAHDACKDAMAQWATFNRGSLLRCELYATATTGRRVSDLVGLPIELLLSGPLGGDAQVGGMIAENRLDLVIFFWDPLTTQPHDVDVKMLLRLAVLHNVPIACNRSSADFLISSPFFSQPTWLARRYQLSRRRDSSRARPAGRPLAGPDISALLRTGHFCFARKCIGCKHRQSRNVRFEGGFNCGARGG